MERSNLVAGVDEVGRGALAGPVVAGACVIFGSVKPIRGKGNGWKAADDATVWIADSKMLSPEEREHAVQWLVKNANIGIGLSSQEDVDRLGIVRATEQAMQKAITHLQELCTVTSLLVDGRDKFRFSLPHDTLIKGDSLDANIAGASIAAKVFRDRLMRRAGGVFPLYGFDQHKGYGSAVHRSAIVEHGPCVLHRHSFLRVLDQQLRLC